MAEKLTTAYTRKINAEKMREYQDDTFIKLNEDNPLYYPKCFFTNTNKKRCVGVYINQIVEGKDIYFEMATSMSQPEDHDRKLYCWKFDPEYKNTGEGSKYLMDEKKLKSPRVIIPIEDFILAEDLIKIRAEQKIKDALPKQKIRTIRNRTIEVEETVLIDESDEESEESDDFILPNADLDLPYSQMTMRDYACIQMKSPRSFKPWLNELIKQSI